MLCYNEYMKITKERKEKFWSLVDIKNNNECWKWKGYRIKDRKEHYGRSRCNGKFMLVHRMAWMLHNKKDIPKGMFVLHYCDNPPCCNPNHLRLGTQQDNMNDMKKRGRSPNNRGEKNPKSKLTKTQVLYIRHYDLDIKDIAKRYGVSKVQIWRIKANKTWANIK